jgi:hypothetical protein
MRAALGFALSLFATVACAQDKPKDPSAPRPSGLTGNVMPRCEAGSYSAGNICKPAPPGFYAVSGATYLTPCPPGKTSPAGSRSPSECK